MSDAGSGSEILRLRRTIPLLFGEKILKRVPSLKIDPRSRLGDIARLRWTHIDLEHAEVSLLTEKTGRTQIIPIAAPLRRFITEELPAHDDPAAPLFPRAHENVQRLGRVGSLSRQFHDLLVKARLVAPEGNHAKEEGSKRRTVHALARFASNSQPSDKSSAAT